MDKNQIIGFSLLALLLIGYIVFNNQEQAAMLAQKRKDSIENARAIPRPAIDSTALLPSAAPTAATAQSPVPSPSIPQQLVTLQNDKLELQFTNRGGFPVSARIKGYKTFYGDSLYLFKGAGNELSMVLPINNGAVATSDLTYTHTISRNASGAQVLTFSGNAYGKPVQISYTLPASEYMLQCRIATQGMPAAAHTVRWNTQSLHTERDLANERVNSQIYYELKDGSDDYYTISNKEDKTEEIEKKGSWIGFRMHFFSTALIAPDGFDKAGIKATNKLNNDYVAANRTTLSIAGQPGNDQHVDLNWYIGPNQYKVLRAYKNDLDNMVPLGYGLMVFVKYINKGIIIPIFNFLSSFISNYGIIIILMTLIIRLVLSFFTYRSYLSAAKMRVLKPEIDELRAKYGEDQQAFGMEQMKLFRTAGVNPLGGCLPTLFQLPILFAMYYFFPSSIELRQQKFLWASDLSTYDSIANLPFNIPFYGDHVSLFTLLMTASSLFLALYNRNMTTQDPNNPALKYMPYIFPFLLIGVFNKMAAALTFYYFFSNMLSIAQQFVIQKFFIDEKKIHAQIQENKNKPPATSKWQQKLEEIQSAQRGKPAK
jgi:YidC/Oxa1 family membrane protein insertase